MMDSVHCASSFLDERARLLGDRLAESLDGKTRCTSFSPSVYDTAWVAMVVEEVKGVKSLMFPECFDWIINMQQHDGSWPCYASSIDTILNTGASLLALLKCMSQIGMDKEQAVNIQTRIHKGSSALNKTLQTWSVQDTDHVGFEVLVPRLLVALEEFGVAFQFPERPNLSQLHEDKMAKFNPELLYNGREMTVLHSLEGLVGLIDFDKLGPYCRPLTGMMGSPSSTAAFLMNKSTHDDNAEAYLRKVIRVYGGGGVPSAWPTFVFDVSWFLTVLLDSGFQPSHFSPSSLSRMSDHLIVALNTKQGVSGFAHGVLPDVDDTAKCLRSLQKLGHDVDATSMISSFENDTHFRTYQFERNPSLSANCNVLLTLLDVRDSDLHTASIEKALFFVLEMWRKGATIDKWNLAPEYSFMGIMDALVAVMKASNEVRLMSLAEELILFEIPVTLHQLATRLLLSQSSDGSWRQSVEVTSYAVLSLEKLLSLPFTGDIRQGIEVSVKDGKSFVVNNQTAWTIPTYLWIEKVTYKSDILSELYCLAASKSAVKKVVHWRESIRAAFRPCVEVMNMQVKLLSKLPLFAKTARLHLLLAVAEASLFTKSLKAARLQIFANRDFLMTEDKYLEWIPLAWTSCNLLAKRTLPTLAIWEMMKLSMLNFQADEYIEMAVSKLSHSELETLSHRVLLGCGLATAAPTGAETLSHQVQIQPVYSVNSSASTNADTDIVEVGETLCKFVKHTVSHPAVLRAPESVQKHVAGEIFTYVAAQITHNEQSRAHFLNQRRGQSDGPTSECQSSAQKMPSKHSHLGAFETAYFEWVRGVASDDTSCPYSFAFFCCLISGPHQYCITGPRQTFVSKALCRSLAAMCRQYNDYGSYSRDMEEGTLNSLDFPDFKQIKSLNQEQREPLSIQPNDAKADLLFIAEFERACMRTALQTLHNMLDPRLASDIQMFVNVTDLFGQLYVVRDIASRQRRGVNQH